MAFWLCKGEFCKGKFDEFSFKFAFDKGATPFGKVADGFEFDELSCKVVFCKVGFGEFADEFEFGRVCGKAAL